MSTLKVDAIRHNSATSDAITTAADGTCTARITGMTGGGGLSHRNIIINGAMTISQRGSSTTTNGYLIDRFRSNLGGIDQMQFTMSQSTDAPSGFRKSLKFDVTTAETGGTGSDEYAGLRYITESQDVAHLLYGTSGAKTITLSFHVKSYQTGAYALNLYMGDSARVYTTTYTINQSATWEKKTLTIVGDTGGSEINVDNGHGLYINWFFASGSTYNSSSANTNQWAGFTNAGWANGQSVDLLNSTDNYFQLAGVQLEVGDTATTFEHISYGEELRRCKRYYQSAAYTTLMGSMSGTVGTPRILFEVEMRDVPSSVTTEYGGNGNGSFRNQNDGSILTGLTTFNYYINGFDCRGGGGGNTIYSSTYKATAEL